MEWRDLIIDGYGRVLDYLKESLAGLTPADLDWQPKPACNSMGWLAWHISRIQDYEIAGLMDAEQLWITGGWHKKFKRPADPDDIGFGHTNEDVAAFKSPDVETQLANHQAVLARTKKYLKSLTAKDLARELKEAYEPAPTVAVRIVSVLADDLQHAGGNRLCPRAAEGEGLVGALVREFGIFAIILISARIV